jgi:redox-regulated HSP33 family molecular chaperone
MTAVAASPQASFMPSAQSQSRIFAQFRSQEGEVKGPQLEVPLDLTPKQLNAVLNELLGNERTEPYSFFVNDQVIFACCCNVEGCAACSLHTLDDS